MVCGISGSIHAASRNVTPTDNALLKRCVSAAENDKSTSSYLLAPFRATPLIVYFGARLAAFQIIAGLMKEAGFRRGSWDRCGPCDTAEGRSAIARPSH